MSCHDAPATESQWSRDTESGAHNRQLYTKLPRQPPAAKGPAQRRSGMALPRALCFHRGEDRPTSSQETCLIPRARPHSGWLNLDRGICLTRPARTNASSCGSVSRKKSDKAAMKATSPAGNAGVEHRGTIDGGQDLGGRTGSRPAWLVRVARSRLAHDVGCCLDVSPHVLGIVGL
ncbi:hypothetical protein VTK56DRAFT_9857 [Thermocarpiscus australiensis]